MYDYNMIRSAHEWIGYWCIDGHSSLLRKEPSILCLIINSLKNINNVISNHECMTLLCFEGKALHSQLPFYCIIYHILFITVKPVFKRTLE